MNEHDWRKQFTGKRIIFILAGLTLLFFLDDFFLVILVQKLHFFKVGDWFYRGALLWFFLANVALAYAVFFIMRRKPTTGIEGLHGAKGVVIGGENGAWRIRVRGEIWNAESDEDLKKGEKVIIERVDGLLLFVRHEDGNII